MSEAADPSTQIEDDVVPIVANKASRDFVLYAFLGLLCIIGFTTYTMLSGAEDETGPVPEGSAANQTGRIEAPPPLRVPQEYLFAGRPQLSENNDTLRLTPIGPTDTLPASPPQTDVIASPPPSVSEPFVPEPDYAPSTPLQRPIEPYTPDRAFAEEPPEAQDDDRVLAARFRNPDVTIPKGTIIPAVLETALDSTRPGGVRALVQRDVYGFDGSQVLIPRGSRLYGEYDTELEQGEKRALVTWTRLMRPDGVMIALESPASDPLGRAGIRGKVDSKFLPRFGTAILQSALDIGIGVAAAEATGGVVVAVPGAGGGGAIRSSETRQIRPSLSVAQGTSVSVFVARDLDFSSVGG